MPKVVISLLVLLLQCNFCYGLDWTRTNPGGGGAFTTVKAGPTGIVLAGSDLSGAYISYDKCKSWEVIGASRGMFDTHVSAMGFDPNNENKIFIGTTEGIYRSLDKGKSFTRTLVGGYVTDIVVSDISSKIVYASYHTSWDNTVSSIYKSLDGGATWKNVSGNNIAGYRIIKILCNPKNDNEIYALTGMGRGACSPAHLLRSKNGGLAWERIASDLGVIMDFDINPVSPSTLYLTTMHADCSADYYYTDREGSFYQSTNKGDTWTKKSDVSGAIFVNYSNPTQIRRVDPRNSADWNTASGMWSSSDAGHTWTKTGPTQGWPTFFNGRKADGVSYDGMVKGLGRDMSDPDVFLWVNAQDCFRSDNGGVTFRTVQTDEIGTDTWQSRGIDNINVLDMKISEQDDNVIYTGSFDIGFWRSLDNGKSWQSGNSSDFTGSWGENGGNVISIVADPSRKNVVWSTQSREQTGEYPTYLIRSNDYGERTSWVASHSGLPLIEVMGLSIDRNSPTNNRKLFVTAQGKVYKSTDDGYHWNMLTIAGNGALRFTAVDPNNGNIVYAGGGSGLWKSSNGGSSWNEVGTAEMHGTQEFWGWGKAYGVFDIQFDPNITNRIYVTGFGPGKGLYRSDNNGTTWQKLWTDDFMRKVGISPNNSDLVIATSSSTYTSGGYNPNSHGVWLSKDAFATAPIQANGDMAWPSANTIAFDRTGNLFVGSNGTGFQVTHITEAEPAGGIDEINSVTSPLSITQNQNIDVTVNFEVSAARDIYVTLQSTTSYETFGSVVKTVQIGSSSAVIGFSFSGNPAPSSDYRLIVYMVPVGADWQQTIGQNTYKAITVKGASPAHLIVKNQEGVTYAVSAIQSYAGTQDAGQAELQDNGNTIHLSGNSWKSVLLAYTLTKSTVIEFDFKSSVKGDIQGLGFDTDNEMSPDRTFQLYGTQSWGLSDFNNYNSGSGWKHYTIPVGSFYMGNVSRLFFTNDHDVSSPNAESSFRNLKIYEKSTPPPIDKLSITVAGSAKTYGSNEINSFGGTQDKGTATIVNNGSGLHLQGNAWKSISLNYTITADTKIAFDLDVIDAGELTGIGFDNDNTHTNTLFGALSMFVVAGSQNANDINNARQYMGTSIVIPVGQYYTGNINRLCFMGDDDANASTDTTFKNIRIYEEENNPPQPQSLVSNLSVNSTQAYEWFHALVNKKFYTDRNYTLNGVPSILENAMSLRTANDDKRSNAGQQLLSFTVNQDAAVYVAYTNVNTIIEASWCNNAHGWEQQTMTIETSLPGDEASRIVRRKFFTAGSTVTLNGNGGTSNACSMYYVMVVANDGGAANN